MITTMGGKNGEMQITNVDKSQYTCCVNQHGVVMNSKYGGQRFWTDSHQTIRSCYQWIYSYYKNIFGRGE